MAVVAAAYVLFAYILAFITGFALPPASWTGFQGWLFFLLLFLSSLTILWFVYQYTDWRNDVYIVTEDAVIDVERQLAIFPLWFIYTEDRRQASLANVQFVDFKVPNPIAVIFNYGDVIVQTAGAEGTLTFLFVSNPAHVHAEVMRRVQDFQDRQRRREFDERWGDMPQWFETYRDMMAQQRKTQGD